MRMPGLGVGVGSMGDFEVVEDGVRQLNVDLSAFAVEDSEFVGEALDLVGDLAASRHTIVWPPMGWAARQVADPSFHLQPSSTILSPVDLLPLLCAGGPWP
jgi:hypothetical protein